MRTLWHAGSGAHIAPLAVSALCFYLSSCGGSSPSTPPTVVARSPIAVSLASNSVSATPGGSASTPLTVTITRPAGDTDQVNLTVAPLPAGVQAQIVQPGLGNSGSVAFTAGAASPAGSTALMVTAADSATTAAVTLVLNIPLLATISNSVNTNAGINGQLQTFMSTSFQPAEWDDAFFQTDASSKMSVLNALRPQHIRLQPVSQGTPQKADKTWDFSTLNSILEPVAAVADNSPELQLATAPSWMNDSNGHLLPAHFDDFAAYTAKMVQYYNTHSGFVDADGVHVHSIFTPITYWGIFNEPNYNGVSAADYVALYNKVVPSMLAAGSEVPIKFVAVELGDYDDAVHRAYFTAFASGVNPSLPVDVVATHYYSSCNQKDSDSLLFTQIVANFLPELQFIFQTNKTSANTHLAAAPVWVTENNVNADYSNNGFSNCNAGQPFVADPRGTDAYFAAWRPYLFSQFGQLGVQSVYHWAYDADVQYGEVDYNTGNTYLSYWVDYYLARYYPFCSQGEPAACTAAGQSILATTTNDPSGSQSVEILATRNPDGSVVIMAADHAVNASSDDNGPGAPRTVVLDVSALGTFAFADRLTMDSTTSPVTGPIAASITPASRITLNFNGYGVTFATFSNSPISRSATPHTEALSASQDAPRASSTGSEPRRQAPSIQVNALMPR